MSLGIESSSTLTVESVRDEFPAIVGDPGRNYIFADAPTGTQVNTFVKLFFIHQTVTSYFLCLIINFSMLC